MEEIKLRRRYRNVLFLLGLTMVCGCATAPAQPERPEEFVEIENPALTMSPGAPATILVPRSSVEKGVPRGRDAVKKGYQALKGAPEPASATGAHEAPLAPPAPARAGITDTAGKPAALVPVFGTVLAVQGERVYFNLGPQEGIAPGVRLRVYRGGTVVKGLGLAPGEPVGTLEVSGIVGGNGGYGVMKEGGPVRVDDLVVRE